MKTKQRMNERGLACAVGTKQADRAATQFALQILQDWPAAKLDAQIIEIDDRSEVRGVLSRACSCGVVAIAIVQTLYPCSDNSKRTQGRMPYPSV